MLEYLCFDFSPFVDSSDIRVSSLEEFLARLHELNAVDVFPVQNKVVSDVTKGLQFLHANDCFHRDLKVANVLVSNQHYCFLENMNDIVDAFIKEPIVCKLADFGESRGKEIQTQEVVNTCTNNVGRGTPAFMAPEILSSNKLSEVRALDLQIIDVWALGMVIFCVLNPDISFLYKRDLELARPRCKEQFNTLTYIRELLTQKRKPTGSEQQREKWSHLVQAYQECTSFEPSSRPSLNHVLEILNSSGARYHDVIPLSVHQGNVIEKADEQIALGVDDFSSTMRNDGINSCAFLCIIIGDQLLNEKAEKTQRTWQDIAILAENVIRKSHSSFNHLRDKKLLYDGQEASSILWKGGILQSRYEMKEEMISPDGVSGIGDPPNKWSNQRTESLNNVIKEANEVIEANVIKQQESEYIKAIYNTGEYRLAPKYKRYSVSPLEWSRKTDEQRKDHVKRVLGCRSENIAEESRNQVITKKLSVDLLNSGIDTISPGLLHSIWHQAEVILSYHQVIDLNDNAFCVTENGTSTNVRQEKNGSITCQCKNAKSTVGLCQHTLAVADKLGILSAYLSKCNMRNNKAGRILNEQVPKRAGEKPREKKKRKGQNNIQSTPIITEKRKADDDIDFPKPMYFSVIWHNRNSFEIAFTRDVKKIIKCDSCKVEFAQGPVVCVPHDIAIMHKERYYYPKKDNKGQVQMVPTFNKEATKFYCVRKSCLLKRHPYFWKGMLTVDDKVLTRFKEGHKRHLHFISYAKLMLGRVMLYSQCYLKEKK